MDSFELTLSFWGIYQCSCNKQYNNIEETMMVVVFLLCC